MRVLYFFPCFCYIFIVAVIEKEGETKGLNKIEAKSKHRVNRKLNNVTKSSGTNGYQTNQ